ncbi:hypothetical protein C8Q79DRAFT_997655 [Trametes meyenii]|nr:hypothetical protein C8Q79DRAFT_997655 [Trametes meyenii]
MCAEKTSTIEGYQWSDALCLAATRDRLWLVSSPNVDYVPTPPLGVKEVYLHDDFRYGEYLCAISRPVPPTHRLAPLWWTPDRDQDFELLGASVVKCLGLLKASCVEHLSVLVDTLSERVQSLLDQRIFPCTFRDVRYWLMASAFLDYYGIYSRLARAKNAVNRGLMGAFTTDPAVAQQFHVWGIPVWWLRQEDSITATTRVYACDQPLEPADIFQRKRAPGAETIYRGLVGSAHLEATCQGGHTYWDISRVPLLQIDDMGGYAAALSQKQHKAGLRDSSSVPFHHRRLQYGATQPTPPPSRRTAKKIWGIEKFAEIEHEWMPPALPAWTGAMSHVAAGIGRRSDPHFWGYWIPEPGLFVRTKTADRAFRYFITWLRLRPGWLYLLRVRDSKLSAISPQWWRDFLYGETGREHKDDTLNGQRQRRCNNIFKDVFNTEDLDLNSSASPSWFGRRVENLDARLCPAIIWEICEMGFRHELLALDRVLVPHYADSRAECEREELIGRVFVDRTAFCVVKLPEEANVGLAARLPHSRVPYLEAFRKVVVRWPRCPPSIVCALPIAINMTADEIEERERELATYYVATFYEESGRAPIVPRAYPVR